MENKNLEQLFRDHLVADNGRLDRIEEKLDRLTETVVALARAEEKLINLERSRQEIADVLDDHEERLTLVEKESTSTTLTVDIITKLAWILTAAGASIAVGYFVQI